MGPHLEDATYRVFLYKTLAGTEVPVLRRILDQLTGSHDPTLATERATQKRSAANVRGFIAFGDYDIIIITRGNDARRRLIESGSIDGIISCVEIVGLRWLLPESDSLRSSELERLDRYPLVSLSTVRTLSSFYGPRIVDPLRKEDEFVKRVERLINPGLLFMAQGAPDFLLLASHKDLDQFNSWIARICSALDPLAKTCSTLAIPSAYAQQILSSEKGTRKTNSGRSGMTLGKLGKLPKDAGVDINIGWARTIRNPDDEITEPPHRASRAPVLRKVWFQPGGVDLVLSYRLRPNSPPPDAMDILRYALEIRYQHGQKLIFETSTRIRLPPPRFTTPTRRPNPRPRPTSELPELPPQLFVKPEHARRIANALQEVGTEVLRTLYSVADMLQDCYIVDDLYDVMLYSLAMILDASIVGAEKLLAPSMDIDRHEILRRISARLTAVNRGIHQRLHGNHRGLHAASAAGQHPLGGFSKILHAAESIPLSLYAQFPRSRSARVPWTGLVNIGRYRDYRSNPSDRVIELPASYLLKPHLWISLIHETAHCLVIELRERNKLPPAKIFLREIKSRHRKDETVRKLLEAADKELYYDCIELHLGPAWPSALAVDEPLDSPNVSWLSWLRHYWKQMNDVVHSGGDLSIDLSNGANSTETSHVRPDADWSWALRPLLALSALNAGLLFHRPSSRPKKNLHADDVNSFVQTIRTTSEILRHFYSDVSDSHGRFNPVAIQLHDHLLVVLSDHRGAWKSVAALTLERLREIAPHLPFSAAGIKKRQRLVSIALQEQIAAIRHGQMLGLDVPTSPELLLWRIYEENRVAPLSVSAQAAATHMLLLSARKSWRKIGLAGE